MKKVSYFIGDPSRISEGLKNRNLSAKDVISITPYVFKGEISSDVVVYFKEKCKT